MALMHGLYYVVEHQSNGNVVRDVGKYDKKSDSFLVGRFNLKRNQCNAYSSQGYSPEDILQKEIHMEDMSLRVSKLEAILSLIESSDFNGAALSANEYLNDHIYFNPRQLIN